jgi:hypothetical protein
LPLQTLPPVHSASLQQAKQPDPAQQLPPPAHVAPEEQMPLVQVSEVHEFPSLHWALLQHSRQAVPQSLGVPGAHAHAELVQTAPALQAPAQLPQWSASLCVFVSQPGFALQSAKPTSQIGLPPAHT